MLFAYLLVGLLFSPFAALFGYDWWWTVGVAPLCFLVDAAVVGIESLVRKRRFNYILVDLAIFLVLVIGLAIYDPPSLLLPVAICLVIYGLAVLSLYIILRQRGLLPDYWTNISRGVTSVYSNWPLFP